MSVLLKLAILLTYLFVVARSTAVPPPRQSRSLFPRSRQEGLLGTLVTTPTFWVLNTVSDLLRITGDGANDPVLYTLQSLIAECDATQPNGLKASTEQRETISALVAALEKFNVTPRPARSAQQEGLWTLLYTDLPPAESSGKIGPFIGAVTQNLEPSRNRIENILTVKSVGIRGVLSAQQAVVDDFTWKITFDRLVVSIFGIKIVDRPFPRQEIRTWRTVFLSDSLRIIRAKRLEKSGVDPGFLFILARQGGDIVKR